MGQVGPRETGISGAVADTCTRGIDVAHRTCTIPDCAKPYLARGWCAMHYSRWQSNGNPLVQRRSQPPERMWDHVQRGHGCWIWTGHRNTHGYGVFRSEGRMYMAHRLAWELTNGPIPDGLFACHHCDNPPCVRPDHLFLGTALDNMRDASAKGRLHGSKGPILATQGDKHYSRRDPSKVLRGSLNGAAKLTPDQVREIRALCAAGVSQRELAVRYGISHQGVSRVVRRRVYADVA